MLCHDSLDCCYYGGFTTTLVRNTYLPWSPRGMSVVLLIDGYNVIAPVAAPGRGGTKGWLAIERQRLLDRLVKHLDEIVRLRTTVIFDAKDAPNNLPSRYDYHGIDVQFAVEHTEADDLLERIISDHPNPKSLTVVSSDHRVQAAARRRRAGAYDSDTWLDRLLDGHTLLQRYPKPKRNATSSPPTQIPSTELPRNTPQSNRERDPIDDEIKNLISDDALDEMIRRHQK
ncbi:NYN domain-containing protein [Rhodopirellula sp. SWK7]|uniref:NYN domain-containing protein n=1 Tax=Rhodopirellula sp. SWK7 TaxID=595460 RepID=UPI0002BEEF14|nr:NYN domain-containing protein [Rhodopirellula sp. SWK7]EMI46949.1 protein containing DUF901 [Rhodopirellula sp. SWK7]